MNEKYELRINSGVLLLLNCPKMMEFGIDYSAWTIGDKFMGIKLIPDGPHFVYYSTPDENNYFKQGFFIHVNSKTKIHIRKWSSEVGDFVSLKEEDEENFRIGVNNLDFDAYLGDYPMQQMDNWKDLTKFITKDILEKLEPISKKYITSTKEYEESEQNIDVKGNIYFTSVPNKKFCLSFKNDPEFLTKINMDKSTMLEELMLKEYKQEPNHLLGEFQYSFITFFLCEIYESFEQWKNLFILICSCQELLVKRENFYCDFIEVVYNMFRQFPKDFFHDNITCNNFLSKIIGHFIKNCELSSASSRLKKRAQLLENFLKDYFNFEIKDEEVKIIEKYLYNREKADDLDEDDELPVIVDESEIEDIMRYREVNEGEGEKTVTSSVREENDIEMN